MLDKSLKEIRKIIYCNCDTTDLISASPKMMITHPVGCPCCGGTRIYETKSFSNLEIIFSLNDKIKTLVDKNIDQKLLPKLSIGTIVEIYDESDVVVEIDKQNYHFKLEEIDHI